MTRADDDTRDDALTKINGIGPAMERALQSAGIPTASALREIGAHEAYRAMVRHGTKPHFIGYYALVMSLQGRPWNDCKGAEKDALRVRFDALLSEGSHTPRETEFERVLDAIGTGRRR